MSKKKELVPKFRFPKYVNSEQWISTELSSLLDYERPDLYIVESDNYKNEGIPVLTANKSFILGYTDEKNNIYSRVPVIIFDDFTTEKKYVDFPFKVKSSAIKILKPKGNNVLKFVFELMNTINFEAKEHKRYYISTYQKLFVYVPKDVKEQQNIADCLSSTDDLIDAESRKLKVLEKYKKGLMQKLFPAEGKTLPEWRFPEFQDCEEWETVKLEKLALYRRGSFPQPYGLPEWYDEKSGMPFIQVFDVDDNMKLKSNTKNKISELAAQQSVFIPKGTLIITIQGSIGRVAITQYDAYIDRTLLLFEKFFRKIDKTFLAYNLQLLFDIEKQKAPGGIIKTITKQALSEFLTSIPRIEEQEKIAGCLSEVDTMITEQSNKVEQLKAHKKGLMQGLFPSLEEADV
ncbi:MAG: restriction endonuclease subunit S [Coprococcus sp.]